MAKGSALSKEMKCSEELQAIVKEKTISRGQMMKAVWKYIKRHNLQGAKNVKGKMETRWIAPDEKLGAVIGTKPLSMFKINSKLSKHLWKENKYARRSYNLWLLQWFLWQRFI